MSCLHQQLDELPIKASQAVRIHTHGLSPRRTHFVARLDAELSVQHILISNPNDHCMFLIRNRLEKPAYGYAKTECLTGFGIILGHKAHGEHRSFELAVGHIETFLLKLVLEPIAGARLQAICTLHRLLYPIAERRLFL